MIYVAYGSNMNVSQMKKRCPLATKIGSYILPGWKLVMRGVADIEQSRHSSVPVGLWNITQDCEAALDQYEGYPHLYTKTYVPIKKVSGLKVLGMVYTMQHNPREEYPAHRHYLRSIVEGYMDFNIYDFSTLIDAQASANEKLYDYDLYHAEVDQ